MKNLNKFMMFSFVIFLVAGCGESFRSQQTTLNSDTTTTTTTLENGFRNSQTAISVDEQILNSYASELSGREAQARSLINAIRALDFTITSTSNTSQVSLEANVIFTCANRFLFKRVLNISELQSGQVVNLGSNGQLNFRVQCTNSSCNEIVTAIRLTDNFNDATILVGMSVNSNLNNSLVYLSRNVNLSSPFIAVFSSGSAFSQMNNCPAPINPNLSISDRIVNILQEEATNHIITESENLLNRWFR